jgi:hypothetical protein
LATEFFYGCSYVTSSSTTLELLKKSGSNLKQEGSPAEIKYLEDPHVFHAQEFISKSFATVFKLRSPYRKGRYFLKVTNNSLSVARPYDPNAAKGAFLMDPSSSVGMIDRRGSQPKPMHKSWTVRIQSVTQETIKSPKKSPWSK